MSGKGHIEMFLVKVHETTQKKLPLSKSHKTELDDHGRIQAVVDCVRGHPALRVDGDVIWQVGEIKTYFPDKRGARMSFQFGKPSVDEEVTMFDRNAKSYAPQKKQWSPCTMIYMDMREGDQILGIEPPSRSLAPSAARVAGALQQALNQCLVDQGVETSIDPMYDTSELKKKLEGAYAITALGVAFGRPNHTLIRATEKFRNIATEMASDIGANNSQHVFESEGFATEKAADFVDTAASGGFSAWAKIKDNADSRPREIGRGKKQAEKLPVGKDEAADTILRKMAKWLKSKKSGRTGR